MIYEPIPIRRCRMCKRDLPLDWFYFREDVQRYRIDCKECYQAEREYTPREKLPTGMKRCNRCKEILPLDSFNADRKGKSADKLQYNCKKCQKTLKRQWYDRRSEEQKRRTKEQKRQYWHTHKKEKQTPRCKPKALMLQQKRRARKSELPNTLTTEQWQHCLEYFGNRCAYCGNPPGLFRFTAINADHWIPLFHPNCPGTIAANIVPACKSCNSSKSASDPLAWLTWKFGAKRAKRIAAIILEYFSAISDGIIQVHTPSHRK